MAVTIGAADSATAIVDNCGPHSVFRIGIYELVTMDDGMRRLIHEQVSENDLSEHARKTSRSLLQNGFDRIRQGETTFAEVYRVTQS